jgi:hypothetical protein
MIRLSAALMLALAMPAGAQSQLGQSRPGGPAPGAPPAGAQLLPGQALPAVPPAPGTTPAPAGPATPSIAPVAPVQAEWVAQGTAELRAIDKVMARTTTLTLKPGETVRFGPLTVTLRSCVVRPPDRAPDAAAFLEIADGANPALFRGWMIASQPQLALVEHATHDIRLYACRP